MWWSRRLVLAAGLAAATGCGFAPAYGPGGPAEALRGDIAVAPPSEPAGYALVTQLEERLGRAGAPLYALTFEISLEEEPVRVSRDEVTLRYQLAGEVAYRLTEAETGVVLRAGSVESFTGYSAAATTGAYRTAARDARERLMTILADRIVAELLATAEEWRR